jgi:hypothetical protein
MAYLTRNSRVLRLLAERQNAVVRYSDWNNVRSYTTYRLSLRCQVNSRNDFRDEKWTILFMKMNASNLIKRVDSLNHLAKARSLR